MYHRFRSNVRTDREGATLAIVAVMVVALLALLSFGIDLGMAYTARAEAQRIADATALAGASAFQDYTHPQDAVVEAHERAERFAEMNGIRGRMVVAEAPEVMIWVIPDSQKVRVRVQRSGLPVWFARFLGQTELTVSAMAAAEASFAGSSHCVKPFAIPDRWEELSVDADGNPKYDKNENGIMDFDEAPGCNGQVQCRPNEVWAYEDGVDRYEPLKSDLSNATTATSWGSEWKGPGRDVGTRMLITPQEAQGASVPSWWNYWRVPGSGGGASGLKETIESCVNLADIGMGVGDEVEFDAAQTQNGSIPQPVWTAVREALLDPDPNLIWDDVANQPAYKEGSEEALAGKNPWESDRIITVALVHPRDVFASLPGQSSLEIVDFATLFLEDPRVVYADYITNPQLVFKYPITGRLVHYGSGALGPQQGTLQRVLRLIE